MAAMKEMSYPERLQAWSYNIIYYFGPMVSEANYAKEKTGGLSVFSMDGDVRRPPDFGKDFPKENRIIDLTRFFYS